MMMMAHEDVTPRSNPVDPPQPAMSSSSSIPFCSHLNFRQAHVAALQRRKSSTKTLTSSSSSSSPPAKRQLLDEGFSSSTGGGGGGSASGDDASVSTRGEESMDVTSSGVVTSNSSEETAGGRKGEGDGHGVVVVVKKQEFRCEDCVCETEEEEGAQAPTTPMLPHHLWKCLESKCSRLLCGKQGKNHSLYHFQDCPQHFLQENFANKRIWCNECNTEVFPDHRNRRMAPGVWVPPPSEEELPPRGLFNIGNTCFMNAALQGLTSVKPLNSYFLGHSFNSKGRNVANGYLWFLNEMWCKDKHGYAKGVMPSRLLHSVRAAHPVFRGFQQHDTQEFLRLFMDTLAEETRVPHFILEDVPDGDSGSDDGNMSSADSEADSFETCDSGNGSEGSVTTGQGGDRTDNNNSSGNKRVKILFKSIVSEIFDGQVESSAQCLSCKQISSRYEVFQDLSLPIPNRDELNIIRTAERFEPGDDGRGQPGWVGWIWDWVKSFFWGPAPSLGDCLAAFFSSDELKGKNMYSCDKCQKLRNGVKRCSLYRLPEILSIHLKRFRIYEYSGGMGFSGKVSQYVQFPLDGLDLSPFLNKDCPSQVTTYRLLGAICHIGSFLGGHYIAYIRKDEEWYLCDDSRVTAVSAETVAECEAYVLFYQKCDLPDHASEIRQEVMQRWITSDLGGTGSDAKYHLLSRKWLTRFMFGEEPGPIDNTDTVCPHGFIVPYDFAHLGSTWVPQSVWDLLVERFSGGPDLLHEGECVICSTAWKKHVKSSMEKDKAAKCDSI